jgi:hypothetical protein
MIVQKNPSHGLMGRLNRHARGIALLSLLGTGALTMGCYGRFPMTKALYRMNGGVPNGIVRNIVFWLLVWFPIYWFAQIGDALIFNLIEFWTGASVNVSSVSEDGKTRVTLETSEDGNVLNMTLLREGEPEIHSRFVRLEDGKYELRDANDEVLGQVIHTPEGNLNLTDAIGNTLQTIDVSEIAARTGR